MTTNTIWEGQFLKMATGWFRKPNIIFNSAKVRFLQTMTNHLPSSVLSIEHSKSCKNVF